jgi:Pyruvate/2-oxoacid:ferredoxin oxidoreductase delta subunit
MQSKNKPAMTAVERAHVARIKEMDCAVCGDFGPSDAHEIEQGSWFTSIPLCRDCHMGAHNGIHGRKSIWRAMKKTELSVLNDTIKELV